jgi:arylsulfatase A-like enzyme
MLAALNCTGSHFPGRDAPLRTTDPTRRLAPVYALFILLGLSFTLAAAPASRPPNIVVILGDDIGYGDFSCNGATAVKTPNVDRLAAEGLRFTSAYSSSATCTPSRYSLLTGEYAFRKRGPGVLPGDAALIIEPGRATLPSLLQRAGYSTAVVGKWHLGLGDARGADWNGEIKPGPLEVGFEYAFIMAATGDRVPCVYIENHRVVGLLSEDPIFINYEEPFPGEPTGVEDRAKLKLDWSEGHNQAVINGIGRIGYLKGGTRMPFLVRWPGRVKPGVSDALISQVDLAASLAALTGQQPDPVTMPDSVNVLPALLGESKTGRAWVVEYANRLAVREGDWKFIPPGRTLDRLGPWTQVTAPEPGFPFNLAEDPGETNDLAARHPDKVQELEKLLGRIRSSGQAAEP